MRRFAALILCVALALPASAGGRRTIPFIVSTEWLASHLDDPGVVVLQVGFSRGEYSFGHVPGARFLWVQWLAPSTPDLSTEMPTLEEATEVLERLGVSPDSRIVCISAGPSLPVTTRMILALSYFGFGDQVALLDGGFERWKAEGRPVSTETPVVARTSLELRTHREEIADAEWLRGHLTDSTVSIVDARAKQFYDGNGGGIARQGHIAGAVHIPYSSMSDSTGRMQPAAELWRIFRSAGLREGNIIITYCHVGQQATVVYLAARSLGFRARVYDGSFEEWNVRDASYAVEKRP